MPWELPDLLDPEIVRQGWQELQTLVRLDETLEGIRNPRLKVSALEMTWYMRHQLLCDSDWAGMGHSVEIRVPFVDRELLRQIAPLLASQHPPTKQDMARTPSSQLPASILNRGKTGFQVPVRDWLLARSKYERLQKGHYGRNRGLRGWAREVYAHFVHGDGMYQLPFAGWRSRLQAARPVKAANAKFRVLMLLTDGFGGFGGIAKFNRDFMTALSSSADVEKVIAVPRLMHENPGALPAKVIHVTAGLGGKQSYIWTVLKAARKFRAVRSRGLRPIVICAHINLLPAAVAVRRITGAELYLIVHGIDAWQPTRDPIANVCLGQVDDFISVSAVTRRRFLQWSGLRQDQGIVLPNCVDLAAFRPAPKSIELIQRYQLDDDRVLLTLGRLASEERYKGFDEIIECLPDIGKAVPNVTYIIAGDGPDRPRLVSKAQSLGLRVCDYSSAIGRNGAPPAVESEPRRNDQARAPRVIFVGRIGEEIKADYFRLADVFVMPSSGEGFGIVLLEAMACGTPVIGSRVDGSREALRQGKLGRLVDPANSSEIKEAVIASLTSSKPDRPRAIRGVEYFSKERFEERVHAIVRTLRGQQAQSEDNGRSPRSPVESPREETLVAALAENDGRPNR
jgi:glycosyltransferase involved in cell wall biosynthesis